jgi:hypothetical protein
LEFTQTSRLDRDVPHVVLTENVGMNLAQSTLVIVSLSGRVRNIRVSLMHIIRTRKTQIIQPIAIRESEAQALGMSQTALGAPHFAL